MINRLVDCGVELD